MLDSITLNWCLFCAHPFTLYLYCAGRAFREFKLSKLESMQINPHRHSMDFHSPIDNMSLKEGGVGLVGELLSSLVELKEEISSETNVRASKCNVFFVEK